MNFLKLIRPLNLFIMAFLMFEIKFCVINPIIGIFNLSLTFTWLDNSLLTIALVCVAAGGYIINDYFDTKIDNINRPDSVIIGNDVPRSNATTYHLAITIIGCILGFAVSLRIGMWQLGFIFPFAAGLLWFYSSVYKKMFLVGNIIIAILTAVVPIMPTVYELRGLYHVDDPSISAGVFQPEIIAYWGIGYGAFAFITTFIREIIKDMEDIDGDLQQDCKTMPIVLGIKTCKFVVATLILATIACLIKVYFVFLDNKVSAIYLGLTVVLPLIYLVYRVLTIKDKSDCHFCSKVSKIIMFAGMCYLFIVKYIFTNFKVMDF